jgi:hypothetical protein
MRFRPAQGSRNREGRRVSFVFEMGSSLIGILVGRLRARAFFRYSGIFLSSLAGVPGVGAAAHIGGPMAAGAARCSDCSSCFDLPEPDCAVYIGTVARLVSVALFR